MVKFLTCSSLDFLVEKALSICPVPHAVMANGGSYLRTEWYLEEDAGSSYGANI